MVDLPCALAGVIAAYQAGLRSRERADRVELAELMLAREQALRPDGSEPPPWPNVHA